MRQAGLGICQEPDDGWTKAHLGSQADVQVQGARGKVSRHDM